MVDTGIHKIHLFHTYDLHFYFSTNTKARWWILKSTKQVKCWIRCIYHCTKHQPQKRERGVLLKATLFILTKLKMIDPYRHWRTSTDFIELRFYVLVEAEPIAKFDKRSNRTTSISG